eukprot:TRINITY_DN1910_c0_g1_i1.p1 TRINITY_DN1910_c0_g1~~TRINITY_DN1910_c0_g1_i1.p1  ORF type:complete len:1965 (-),score=604.88 TRINITY_DN1910_c0_g1_i1:429-5591(-)
MDEKVKNDLQKFEKFEKFANKYYKYEDVLDKISKFGYSLENLLEFKQMFESFEEYFELFDKDVFKEIVDCGYNLDEMLQVKKKSEKCDCDIMLKVFEGDIDLKELLDVKKELDEHKLTIEEFGEEHKTLEEIKTLYNEEDLLKLKETIIEQKHTLDILPNHDVISSFDFLNHVLEERKDIHLLFGEDYKSVIDYLQELLMFLGYFEEDNQNSNSNDKIRNFFEFKNIFEKNWKNLKERLDVYDRLIKKGGSVDDLSRVNLFGEFGNDDEKIKEWIEIKRIFEKNGIKGRNEIFRLIDVIQVYGINLNAVGDILGGKYSNISEILEDLSLNLKFIFSNRDHSRFENFTEIIEDLQIFNRRFETINKSFDEIEVDEQNLKNIFDLFEKFEFEIENNNVIRSLELFFEDYMVLKLNNSKGNDNSSNNANSPKKLMKSSSKEQYQNQNYSKARRPSEIFNLNIHSRDHDTTLSDLLKLCDCREDEILSHIANLTNLRKKICKSLKCDFEDENEIINEIFRLQLTNERFESISKDLNIDSTRLLSSVRSYQRFIDDINKMINGINKPSLVEINMMTLLSYTRESIELRKKLEDLYNTQDLQQLYMNVDSNSRKIQQVLDKLELSNDIKILPKINELITLEKALIDICFRNDNAVTETQPLIEYFESIVEEYNKLTESFTQLYNILYESFENFETYETFETFSVDQEAIIERVFQYVDIQNRLEWTLNDLFGNDADDSFDKSYNVQENDTMISDFILHKSKEMKQMFDLIGLPNGDFSRLRVFFTQLSTFIDKGDFEKVLEDLRMLDLIYAKFGKNNVKNSRENNILLNIIDERLNINETAILKEKNEDLTEILGVFFEIFDTTDTLYNLVEKVNEKVVYSEDKEINKMSSGNLPLKHSFIIQIEKLLERYVLSDNLIKNFCCKDWEQFEMAIYGITQIVQPKNDENVENECIEDSDAFENLSNVENNAKEKDNDRTMKETNLRDIQRIVKNYKTIDKIVEGSDWSFDDIEHALQIIVANNTNYTEFKEELDTGKNVINAVYVNDLIDLKIPWVSKLSHYLASSSLDLIDNIHENDNDEEVDVDTVKIKELKILNVLEEIEKASGEENEQINVAMKSLFNNICTLGNTNIPMNLVLNPTFDNLDLINILNETFPNFLNFMFSHMKIDEQIDVKFNDMKERINVIFDQVKQLKHNNDLINKDEVNYWRTRFEELQSIKLIQDGSIKSLKEQLSLSKEQTIKLLEGQKVVDASNYKEEIDGVFQCLIEISDQLSDTCIDFNTRKDQYHALNDKIGLILLEQIDDIDDAPELISSFSGFNSVFNQHTKNLSLILDVVNSLINGANSFTLEVPKLNIEHSINNVVIDELREKLENMTMRYQALRLQIRSLEKSKETKEIGVQIKRGKSPKKIKEKEKEKKHTFNQKESNEIKSSKSTSIPKIVQNTATTKNSVFKVPKTPKTPKTESKLSTPKNKISINSISKTSKHQTKLAVIEGDQRKEIDVSEVKNSVNVKNSRDVLNSPSNSVSLEEISSQSVDNISPMTSWLGTSIKSMTFDSSETNVIPQKIVATKHHAIQVDFVFDNDAGKNKKILEELVSISKQYASDVSPLLPTRKIDDDLQKKSAKSLKKNFSNFNELSSGVQIEVNDAEDDGKEIVVTKYAKKQVSALVKRFVLAQQIILNWKIIESKGEGNNPSNRIVLRALKKLLIEDLSNFETLLEQPFNIHNNAI